jgi:hypothetical protein
VAEDDRVRIEVGFEGGGALSALTSTHLVDQLEQALGRAEGAFAIDADEGRYTLVLSKIVYLKRFSRESRVGFGAL